MDFKYYCKTYILNIQLKVNYQVISMKIYLNQNFGRMMF